LIAAASVIASGEKKARPAPKPRAEIPMPEDLAQALSADPAAQAVFEGSRHPTGATIWNGSPRRNSPPRAKAHRPDGGMGGAGQAPQLEIRKLLKGQRTREA
jgi:hypothetical protein